MVSSSCPPTNIVPLFGRAPRAPQEALARAQVVRAFAEATASLGRAAELIDEGNLEPETKLVLVRGVKELVIRTFGVNTAFMEAEAETFRMRPGQAALACDSGGMAP
ncbi:hypothetical protein [Phreatobacter cathodiphilus]|uniref:Uncharacterized protein n=1 Tax=Phreatobacter cathodiphilus TaxID=1868589 RepID=A0A2S0N6V5_9HYPH|nr:hypothetical protein [Phreatobacter cathodiphilus]AVO43892.1 hypothetical protein C6569_01750 [Phreatobacter cathodiphilus]